MEELRYELKIPKERIAVLIGKAGETKREIEKATKTNLEIDSKEGDVFIIGKDGLDIYTAKEVITAIGRGFNPEVALLLLKVDYVFEAINLADQAGKSKDSLLRLKGRVIGREGKTRHIIEELTETYVSVFGKTISIIGNNENVVSARRAVEMLIGGSTHASVYKWLEKQRGIIKRSAMEEGTEKWRMK